MRFSEEVINRAPFLRLFIPFISGIITALLIPGAIVRLTDWSFFVVLLFSLVLVILNPARSYRNRYYSGLWVFIFFFSLGCCMVFHGLKREQEARTLQDAGILLVEVVDQPVGRDQTYKVEVRTQGYLLEDEWITRRFYLLGYFQKDVHSQQIRPGDLVWIHATPEVVKLAGNPYEFNYPRYLADRGIYGRFFARPGDWNFAGPTATFSLLSVSAGIRSWCVETLNRFHLQDDALAIGSALIVGERDAVEADLRDAFADAGIVHIMAVSGLHVGIIYLVFSYLLRFLKNFKYGRMLRTLILLCILWWYAMLTGLNPPVMRATTMFSFIVLGQGLYRIGNVYNSLIAAAFILLFLNPFLIRSASFLLSFSAVAGIIFLYPKIFRMVDTRSWFLKRIWMLMSLSISAQLGTLPLVLYFFNQFPAYFLLTNLLAIPLVGIIICLGFCILIFSFVPFLADISGRLLNALIQALIYGSDMVGSWPHAVLRPVYLSPVEVVSLYLILTLVVLYLLRHRIEFLNAALAVAILFILTGFWITQGHHRQRHFMVLNVSNASVYQYIDGRSAHIITTDTAGAGRPPIEFATSGSWKRFGIKASHWHELSAGTSISIPGAGFTTRDGYFQYGDLLGVISGYQASGPHATEMPFAPDVLVITGRTPRSLQDMMPDWRPKVVVIDSSVPWYRKRQLKALMEAYSWPYHDVTEDGAYIVDLGARSFK